MQLFTTTPGFTRSSHCPGDGDTWGDVLAGLTPGILAGDPTSIPGSHVGLVAGQRAHLHAVALLDGDGGHGGHAVDVLVRHRARHYVFARQLAVPPCK